MPREKLYKNCINKPLLICSDGFPHTQNQNPHDSATSTEGFFCFAIGIFLIQLLTAHLLKKFKILSFSQAKIYIEQQNPPNILERPVPFYLNTQIVG
jgi:hypothetical protein